jgi:hypothetical protein
MDTAMFRCLIVERDQFSRITNIRDSPRWSAGCGSNNLCMTVRAKVIYGTCYLLVLKTVLIVVCYLTTFNLQEAYNMHILVPKLLF